MTKPKTPQPVELREPTADETGVEPYVLDGFPVHVSLDYADGELELHDVRAGKVHRFTITDGVTAAHTAARLELLTSIGGTPLLDYSPTGDAAGPSGGTES